MKKLLYILFAFALIVACEKDSYDQDVENINVLEQAEEINASVSSEDFTLEAKGILDAFLGDGVIEAPTKPKGSASTARPGDNGDNWIQILIFDLNGKRTGHARADNIGEACFPDGAVEHFYATYYWDATAAQLRVEQQDGTIGAPVGGGSRTALYNGAFGSTTHNVVLEVNANNSAKIGAPVLNVVDFDFSCSTVYEYGTRIIGGAHDGRVIVPIDPTNMDSASNPTAAAVGTENIQLQVVRREAGFGVLTWENVGDPFTNPNYVTPVGVTWTPGTETNGMTMVTSSLGSYRLESAPFPLTGMLATMESKTGAASTRNVRNFAGTSASDVRDAIEDDYEGVTNN